MRGVIIAQNKMYFKYCFYIILLIYFFYLKYTGGERNVDERRSTGLLVPIETRIGNLESRFDNLESRFDKLESRFDNLESRFDSLETRVDNFESETKRRFENLEANLRSVDKHVCELDASVSELQRSVKELWLHVENTTDWKLQVVAENHSNLLQKLEEQQKRWETQERLLFYVNKHEKDITAIKQRLCM